MQRITNPEFSVAFVCGKGDVTITCTSSASTISFRWRQLTNRQVSVTHRMINKDNIETDVKFCLVDSRMQITNEERETLLPLVMQAAEFVWKHSRVDLLAAV